MDGIIDDIDTLIDPSLCNEDSEDNSSTVLSPVSSPLLPHSRPLASPFIPSGRTAITSLRVSATPSSRPASAGSFLRGSTPSSDAVGSRASSVTPASSVFKLTHRPSVHPVAKKNNQPAFRTPELPTTHPSWAGFSTGNEVVQHRPAASVTANQQSVTAFANPRVHTTVFSDRLANLDSTVLDLAAKVDRLSLQCRSAALKPQVQYLIEENDIFAVPSVKSVEKATKAVRDNTFNTAIRQMFLHAMGISDSKLAATPESLEEGAVVLRPNFDSSWTENAAWREDMIRYVQQKACDVYGQLREEHLKKKNDADITKQLKEVFENMKDVIKKGGKGTDATEARNRKQRQNARKFVKTMSAQLKIMLPVYRRVGHWSGCEPSVDFESDTENAPKRPAKSKNIDATWTSRPPSYRDTLDGPTRIYRKDESEESITDVLVDGTRDLAHPPTDYDGMDGGTEVYDDDEEGLEDDEGNMRKSAGTNDADFDASV
ncbi:hypothetical protein DFH29DRAFT_999578 [Suillus ampliporus]|nr:hypothetical protein DFH29DRAFT_999578 [Suillus ampliporus]